MPLRSSNHNAADGRNQARRRLLEMAQSVSQSLSISASSRCRYCYSGVRLCTIFDGDCDLDCDPDADTDCYSMAGSNYGRFHQTPERQSLSESHGHRPLFVGWNNADGTAKTSKMPLRGLGSLVFPAGRESVLTSMGCGYQVSWISETPWRGRVNFSVARPPAIAMFSGARNIWSCPDFSSSAYCCGDGCWGDPIPFHTS